MAALTSADFKRLHWNLALLAVLLGLGGSLVALTLKQEKAAQQILAKSKAEYADMQGKLARVQDEEKELREKIIKYKVLQARGVIGEERRLEWVETLRAIKENRRLIDFQYELSPQIALDPLVAPGVAPGFEFMNSPMKAQIQLLHEDDLLKLVSDIDTRAHAFTRVRRCAIQRISGVTRELGPSPQLRADCELDWVTVREPR